MSRDPHLGALQEQQPVSLIARLRQKLDVRTHVLLVLAMALVIVIVTAVGMLMVRHRLREQVTDDLSLDLDHSVLTFQNLQAERLGALDRENALLAELPTLKALMTSGDNLTIQDGAVEFWQLSGDDLFALVQPNGHVVAAYTKGIAPDAIMRKQLEALSQLPDRHYLINGRSLYAYSLKPLYFGNDEEGTLLGYVISGVSIERTVRQISQPTGVEATFVSDGQILASTLDPVIQSRMVRQSPVLAGTPKAPTTVSFAGVRYLAATEDLSTTASSPLQLVVLKSFEPAERWIDRIDRMVLSAGVFALLSGTILMVILSRLLTRPLEELSKSVRAFGMGDSSFRIPRYGTQEVRQLSSAFAGMRDEIHHANRALVESERLATIGRMASSVSHDLRHYLAAVYANAEFLTSDDLSPEERADIFADIRTAVLGTTDMIESLLIFSRTGNNFRRSRELLANLVDRSVALIRPHPDADRVELIARCGDPSATAAVVDGKQIERAIFNLLHNACQAIRSTGKAGTVTVTLEVQEQYLVVSVIDDGPGVPEGVRENLFEPFVSEGKQKGTGLGLTLAHCIAMEHDGEVVLFSSRCGETIFQMKIAHKIEQQTSTHVVDAKSYGQVPSHEKAWT